MHMSFGMECQPKSMKWEDLMRGPSLAEVGRHLNKVVNYNSLRLAAARDEREIR